LKSITLSQTLPQLVAIVDTDFEHYEIWDTYYSARPARVLYSGQRQTAQSGIAVDANPHLLFDYNQRLLELVCGVEPECILLIGGGAYTLPMALLRLLPKLHIDVVEIDAQLAPLAEAYFGLRPDRRQRQITADGRDFLEQSKQCYDIIIIDAFQQASVPGTLIDESAAALVEQHLKPNGIVAYNVIAYYRGPYSTGLRRRIATLRNNFPSVNVYPVDGMLSHWLQQNYLLIGQLDSSQQLDAHLRFPALH